MFKSSETGGRGKWGFHGDTAIKKIKFIRLNLVLDTDMFKVKVIFQQFLTFKRFKCNGTEG